MFTQQFLLGFVAGAVVTIILIVIWLMWEFNRYKPNNGYDWEYQEEAKKYDDLKSGKFTEYEG